MNGTLKPQNTLLHPERLRKRSEFLSMRGAKRVNSASFTLQARRREAGEIASLASRFGLTVTRKSGNAVQRNRIRRRLRDAVRQVAGDHAVPGHDYVIIAKAGALTQPFSDLTCELTRGLCSTSKLHKDRTAKLPRHHERRVSQVPKTRAGKLT